MARPPDQPDPILDVWRTLVATRDPVQVCRYFVRHELETRILPAFPEPGADYNLFAHGLTPPLVDRALAKLAKAFPTNATRGIPALIRARKKRAYQVCREAIAWVETEYADDARAHPDDRLAERVRRLAVAIETLTLESWRGKAADRMGELAEYGLLFHEEDWMQAFAGLFPEREWTTGTDTTEAERNRLAWRWIRLEQAQTASQLPWPVPGEVLRTASEAKTPEKAVLIILSRTASLARGQSPVSLKRRLTRARGRAAERFPRPDVPDSPSDGR
jgi:hypothetical protein